VFGLLGMLANWVICVLLCEKVGPNLGFHRKDREDPFIFEMFTLISFGNFLFNASMSMFPGREADLFGTLFSHLGSNDCDVEHIVYAQRTVARLFFFLFPGGLFVGYLMWPFAGFVWPYLSTLGALRCRFHGSSGSALSARRLNGVGAIAPWNSERLHGLPGATYVLQSTALFCIEFHLADLCCNGSMGCLDAAVLPVLAPPN